VILAKKAVSTTDATKATKFSIQSAE